MVGAQWLATCVRSHDQIASATLLHLALERMDHGALASAARANHEQDLRASGALDSLGNLLRAVASALGALRESHDAGITLRPSELFGSPRLKRTSSLLVRASPLTPFCGSEAKLRQTREETAEDMEV